MSNDIKNTTTQTHSESSLLCMVQAKDLKEMGEVCVRLERVVDYLYTIQPTGLAEALAAALDEDFKIKSKKQGVEKLNSVMTEASEEMDATLDVLKQGIDVLKQLQVSCQEVGEAERVGEDKGQGNGEEENPVDSSGEVEELIEQVALDVMTVDVSDPSALSDIHSHLQHIAQGLKNTQAEAAEELAEALAGGVEKIIFGECEAVADPISVIRQGVTLLQRLFFAWVDNRQDVAIDPEFAQNIALLLGYEGAEVVSESESQKDQGKNIKEEAEVQVTSGDVSSAAFETVPSSLIDVQILDNFALEAEENLGEAESALLALESNPKDEEHIHAVFRSFHTVKGAAGFLNLHDVSQVAHGIEDLLTSIRNGELQLQASILDVAFEAIDVLKGLIETARRQFDEGEIRPVDISTFLAKVAGAAGNGEASGGHVSPAPEAVTEPADSETVVQKRAGEVSSQGQYFIRVGTEKLDQMVNMVGELVISQTQVSQNQEIVKSDSEKLMQDISQVNRVTRDLQEMAMSLRMVPIRSTFERMARMVRDLARKCDKQVVFEMSGEDTELDKNMVEEIVDPLTHMVRNAVDHGVESAEEREVAGKTAQGTVVLAAYHEGGNIVIELRDDGKGLDLERILQKAEKRGLVHANEELTDEQIRDLIFHPGFSTADQVSEISGRGVGMDVVRRSIEKLRGKIEVQSELGRGTTFTVRLPLTLAIIDGMVVGVGTERYILPLTSIVRSFRPLKEEVFTVMGEGEMVKVRDDLFPILRLYERFKVMPQHKHPWKSLVVLVEAEAGCCCLLVDELLGIQQVVIKGLEDDLRHDKGLSGCTILGDGRVGLILDVNDMVQQANGRVPGGVGREATVLEQDSEGFIEE